MFGAWWNAALLVASVALLPFDRRMILGLNSWIKPMKFEISLIVYSLTLALLFSVLGEDGRWRKQRRRMSWGIGIAAAVEITLIALQSARRCSLTHEVHKRIQWPAVRRDGRVHRPQHVLLADLLWLSA